MKHLHKQPDYVSNYVVQSSAGHGAHTQRAGAAGLLPQRGGQACGANSGDTNVSNCVSLVRGLCSTNRVRHARPYCHAINLLARVANASVLRQYAEGSCFVFAFQGHCRRGRHCGSRRLFYWRDGNALPGEAWHHGPQVRGRRPRFTFKHQAYSRWPVSKHTRPQQCMGRALFCAALFWSTTKPPGIKSSMTTCAIATHTGCLHIMSR